MRETYLMFCFLNGTRRYALLDMQEANETCKTVLIEKVKNSHCSNVLCSKGKSKD